MHAPEGKNLIFLNLIMQGAFVVRLSTPTEAGRLTGSVEEVDTGKQTRFASGDELIAILRESIAQTLQNWRQKEKTHERKDDPQ
jgi:hypothetical protein